MTNEDIEKAGYNSIIQNKVPEVFEEQHHSGFTAGANWAIAQMKERESRPEQSVDDEKLRDVQNLLNEMQWQDKNPSTPPTLKQTYSLMGKASVLLNSIYAARANPVKDPKVERLIEALRFYADGKNWTTHDNEMLFINVSEKDWDKNKSEYFSGGKRARAALAEWEDRE